MHLKNVHDQLLVTFSEFNNCQDNKPKAKQVTWQAFLKYISTHQIREAKDGKAFAPVAFINGGTRSKENAVSVSMLVLDIDNGSTTEAATEKIKKLGLEGAIYTTHSHTKEHNKFRIVIPLKTTIPANFYPILRKWAVKHFPVDPNTKDVSRMFYYPSHPANEPTSYFEHIEGELLDWGTLHVEELLVPEVTIPEIAPTKTKNGKPQAAYVQAAVEAEAFNVRNAAQGKRNSTLNKAAFALSQFLHTGMLTRTEIEAELLQAALSIGIQNKEALTTIASGIKAGSTQPREIPESAPYCSPTKYNTTNEATVVHAPKEEPFIFHSLKSLYYKQFAPVSFLVPGILPEHSVNIIAGKPKAGKSNFISNLALSVAYGGIFLGKRVEKANVLYLNLEDGERRLKERIEAIIGEGEEPPDNFDYISGVSEQQAILAIDEWLSKQQGKKLVIIDTLAKFRERQKRNENLYGYDYHSLQPIRELSEKYQAAFILIHHTNKSESDDPIDLASGSLGLTGAADNVLVLKRARGSADRELHAIGRDIEDLQLALKFDYPYWTVLGDPEEYSISKERLSILNLLKEHDTLKVGELHERLKPEFPSITYNSVKQFIFQMKNANQVKDMGRGSYALFSKKQKTPTPTTNLTNLTNLTNSSNLPNYVHKEDKESRLVVSNGEEKLVSLKVSKVSEVSGVSKENISGQNLSHSKETSAYIKQAQEWLQTGLLDSLPPKLELPNNAERHNVSKAVHSLLAEVTSDKPHIRHKAEQQLREVTRDISYYLKHKVVEHANQ